MVVVGCCWLLLVAVDCCWLLLVVVGCGWLLLVVVGCCWLLLVVVGCSWLLLVVVVVGDFAVLTIADVVMNLYLLPRCFKLDVVFATLPYTSELITDDDNNCYYCYYCY